MIHNVNLARPGRRQAMTVNPVHVTPGGQGVGTPTQVVLTKAVQSVSWVSIR